MRFVYSQKCVHTLVLLFPVTTSPGIRHVFSVSSDGARYIISIIVFSMIARSPLAPVFFSTIYLQSRLMQNRQILISLHLVPKVFDTALRLHSLALSRYGSNIMIQHLKRYCNWYTPYQFRNQSKFHKILWQHLS